MDEAVEEILARELDPFLTLLGTMKSVAFYVKDYRGLPEGEAGRFVYANHRFLRDKGLASEEGILGRTDFDFHVDSLAAQYVREDWQVLRSGECLGPKTWLVVEQPGLAHVWRSSKYPILDAQGNGELLVGLMEEVDSVAGKFEGATGLTKVLLFIQTRIREPLSVDQLASVAGMSRSHFNRRFRQEFGDSVGQYIKRTRIETSAIELVASRKSVKEVAEEFGFFDASHYSRIFKQVKGVSPKDYVGEEH